MVEIFRAFVFTALGTIGFVSLLLAVKFIRADKNVYDMNKELTGGFWKVVKGRVNTFHEGHREYSVKAGLAVNIANNTFVEQGALSRDSINCVLK